MKLLSFFNKINPVEVVKVLKNSDEKILGKGILAMGGSGVLITSGVTLITDGATYESWYEIVGGAIMLIVGAFVGVALSSKVEELKNNSK